ncbi:MAG: hypothetical protein ACYDAD_14565 [Acidimicrobiales bacterium]
MNLKRSIAATLAGATLLGGAGVAGGSLSAAAATNTTPTAGTTSPAPPQPACKDQRDGEWPDFATGRPKGLDAHDRGGVYMWHNEDGWHLWVTHRGDDKRVYTGTIATSGTLTAQRVHDERSDKVWVGPKDHELHFRFVNYGFVDGVDFQTRCAPSIKVSVQADGHELGTERVYIGHGDTNPTSVPFSIQRAS